MDKNKIIIGGAALVLGGAIATGVILNIGEQSSNNKKCKRHKSHKFN